MEENSINFAKLETTENNKEEIQEALKLARLNGKSSLDWELLKEYLKKSIEEVLRNVYHYTPQSDISSLLTTENVDNIHNTNPLNNSAQQNKLYVKPQPNLEELIGNINKLKKSPFTLQRMCELLDDPLKYHKSLNKFLSAFNKLADVEN